MAKSGDTCALRVAALVGALALLGSAAAAAAATTQETFATPQQAVDRLVAALQASRTNELLRIVGSGSRKFIVSGDPVADAQARRRFVAAYEDENRIELAGNDRAVLSVGKDGWDFPFPIVKRGNVWQFDAAAGADELINRRIGANELDTIKVCHAYVDAQREYAEADRNNDGLVEYAQKFLSSAGKQDGLYWPSTDGEEESPIGPLIVRARAEGYSTEPQRDRQPYHGYYYRILKGQGPAAKDGAYDYVVNGHMIGGFALVAFPAQYGVSGVMTFIVNHDDVVYQKDLGPQTLQTAEKMTLFDPDPSWRPAPGSAAP